MGFDRVITAGDGLEGLRICQTEQPEIILTDIAMQGIIKQYKNNKTDLKNLII